MISYCPKYLAVIYLVAGRCYRGREFMSTNSYPSLIPTGNGTVTSFHIVWIHTVNVMPVIESK